MAACSVSDTAARDPRYGDSGACSYRAKHITAPVCRPLGFLLETNLSLAARHHGGRQPALNSLGFSLYLVGNTEAGKHLTGEVRAARAIRIRDRLCCEESSFERFDRSDVCLGELARNPSKWGASRGSAPRQIATIK